MSSITIRILVLTRFFSCGWVEIKNEKYKEALCKLLGELETSTATTLINLSYEATKESIHYLVSATFPFKNQIKIPEKLIEGENGYENLNYRENDWLDWGQKN